jgi:hypothetical protein
MSNEYLKRVLADQTLAEDSDAMIAVRQHRQEVEDLIRAKWPAASMTIRYGGSKAKGTLIKASYDLDIIVYVHCNETALGSTLKDIYDSVATSLGEKFFVQRKTSALRLRVFGKGEKGEDLHIDVVPGRYTDESKTDVYLHQESGDKERLKTNLQVHIDHIRDSGVVDAIRLMKLWRVQNGISMSSFIMDLLVIDLLEGRKAWGLEDQLDHVLKEFRDKATDLKVEDPANPHGNDLSPKLDQHRHTLEWTASKTLDLIENSGWEAVFGKIEEDKSAKVAALRRVAAAVAVPSRPHGSRNG